MKLREIASIVVLVAVLFRFFVAHEAPHTVSEKITEQPVTLTK